MIKEYVNKIIICCVCACLGFLLSVFFPGCSRTFKHIWVEELTPTCNVVLNLSKVIYNEERKQVSALPIPVQRCLDAENRVEKKLDRKACIKEVWLQNKVNWDDLKKRVHFDACMKNKGH